jgi:hypothetical protein
MPTSSPAPFWKYAEQTPLKFGLDSSPIKGTNLPPVPASSTPVPARKASPTRNSQKEEVPKVEELEEDDEEDQGFDLTKCASASLPFRSLSNGNPDL